MEGAELESDASQGGLDMNFKEPEIPKEMYIASGSYDITNMNKCCNLQQSSPISGFIPPPLPLEVHATLNYQPKKWTAKCGHRTNYVVDVNGNVYYVSHNECQLECSNEGDQCFIYEPQFEYTEDTTTPPTTQIYATVVRKRKYSECSGIDVLNGSVADNEEFQPHPNKRRKLESDDESSRIPTLYFINSNWQDAQTSEQSTDNCNTNEEPPNT